ncbi:MAG: hypothetical protein U0173_05445 [Nitrospiraceae bacterium]
MALVGLISLVGAGCVTHQAPQSQVVHKPVCERTITADVVALDQVYYYNRFGSFNPAGIMYALRKDVVLADERDAGGERKHEPENKELDLLNGDLDQWPNEVEQAISSEPGPDDLKLVGRVKLRSDKRPRPLVLRANEGDCLQVRMTNLLAPSAGGQELMLDPERRLTHPEKRLVVSNDGDEPTTRHASMHVNGLSLVDSIDSLGANVGRNGWHDQSGNKTDGRCSADPVDFGKDLCALAAPGETRIYTWYAKKEGTYFFYSMAAPAGGEGDGGQLGLGLFGAVNVQPRGANWYRSQVAESDLKAATTGTTTYGQPIIAYEAVFAKGPRKGDPILNMLKCRDKGAEGGMQGRVACPSGGELVYSDLNAVVDIEKEASCEQMGEGNACGLPYREFTVIFHDEVTAVQAFDDIRQEDAALASIRDGMGINYGVSGLGPMVVANRQKLGPARDCAECKLEEFFLTSWVNGDPAMVVGYERNAQGDLIKIGETTVKGRDGKPERRPLYKMKAKYPDDPSNVHHSYLGDPIRFRNMHAGPKETHVFHLHAHQWVEDKHDPQSHYLDSQTISPGTAFSYEVHYGGSGNRNLGPGDSIFHCHLYPHFAQGMWELWRAHDVFEDGSRLRWLPDHDIEEGTPTPAVVPLPRTPLAPMPTKDFKGYPFYIAGEKGHRPPQPPLDIEGEDHATALRRHVVMDGAVLDGSEAHGPQDMKQAPPQNHDLFDRGRQASADIAARVSSQNRSEDLSVLARELERATVKTYPNHGNEQEQAAMRFHAGQSIVNGAPAVRVGAAGWQPTPYNWEAPGYKTCLSDGTCDSEAGTRVLFRVNGGGNVELPNIGKGEPGAPFSNPCPKQWIDESGKIREVKVREYRAVYIQMDMTVNKSGWHDPQARFPVLEEDVQATLDGKRPTEPLFFRAQSGECVVFKATNLIPSNLNLDDFQVYSPTDTIGQHIHLVKFDVTSSDGSGNGWNYEDGTLAADEIRERIHAIRAANPATPIKPHTHRLFLRKGQLGATEDGALAGDSRGYCSDMGGNDNDRIRHPWCGAQTTIQRWWADPVLNAKPGDKHSHDRTLRTVFTHDHFGPSSHQHHGFYAALVVEPRNSKWFFPDGRLMGGTDAQGKPEKVDGRHDGGPTFYAANLIVRGQGTACITEQKDGLVCSDRLDHKDTIDDKRTAREFNLAFADFAIVYDRENQPINPPSQIEGGLRTPILPGRIPVPEGISTKDPGTQLINYRNEPIPLRIATKASTGKEFVQLSEQNGRGDLAHVFSSVVHDKQSVVDSSIFTEGTDVGRESGDPATPLLRAYEGDRVQIRLIQGAQEEQHVFTMHGAKWLAQPDSTNTGYVSAQHIGISEHFEFNDRVVEFMPFDKGNGSRKVVDHLYASGATDNLWDGQWGLMRVFSRTESAPGLTRLPGNTERTHDVLASAFVQQGLDETLDSELFEVVDGEASERTASDSTDLEEPKDALEAFCRSAAQQSFQQHYEVEAWLAKDLLPGGKLVYNEHFGIADPNAILFVEASEVSALRSGGKRAEPLILRARAGDCIRVTLKNMIRPEHHLDGPDNSESWSYNMVPPIVAGFSFNQVRSSHRVGLHPQLVDHSIQTSDGAHVGVNDDSTVGPGEPRKTYYWYAGEIAARQKGKKIVGIPYEFGAIPLQDMGDVIKHASHGAIGALIVEPQCSEWKVTGSRKDQAEVDYWNGQPVPGQRGKRRQLLACPPKPAEDSRKLYRFNEMVLLYQDNLSLQQYGQPIPNLRNGDDSEDSGQKAFNYRTEPLWARLGASAADEPDAMSEFDWSNVLSSTVPHFRCDANPSKGRYCDPETPLFTAKAGDHLRFRVVHPGGHPRQHGFTLFGHDWGLIPWINDSRTMGWNQFNQARVGSTGGIGPGRAINILTAAGGDCKVTGDYLYRTQEGFMFGGGLWGILRVEENPRLSWWEPSGWFRKKLVNNGDEASSCKVALSQAKSGDQP